MTDEPWVFLRYQREFTEAIAANSVVVEEKSRRIGISWTAGAVAPLTAMARKEAGGMDVFYMGYNLEMAREFIDYCAEWSKHFAAAAAEVEEYVFRDPDNPDKDIKAFRIVYDSGFKILALPSAPRALRGMQGLVIIDEAAFHEDLAELLKSAFALLIWGGKVVVISTHNGEEHPFNALINDIRSGRKKYKLLRTTFDDALADGLYKRICMTRGLTWSAEAEAAWRQDIVDFYGEGADEELFCIPSKGGGAFIPLALIERATMPDIPVLRWQQPESFAEFPAHIRKAEALDFCEEKLKPLLSRLHPDRRTYLGEDFARHGDLSVYWPAQEQPDTRLVPPFVLELAGIPFDQQREVLFYIIDRLPCFVSGAFDATGNGAYLAETAAQRYGFGRIFQIKLNEGWYRENMPRFKASFEDGAAVIPQDAETIHDHRAIKLMRGVGQIDRDGRTASARGGKRHGDSAIAHLMMRFAAIQDVHEYGYTPANAQASPDQHHDDDDADLGQQGRAHFGQGAY